MGDGNWNGSTAGAQQEKADDKVVDVKTAPHYATDKSFGIFLLKAWVLNQQPAHISALADQFAKAYSMLYQLEQTIRDHATKLFDETWTHSEARDAFMKKGPGTLLEFIQNWQQAALSNQAALLTLIGPIQKSQADMQILWDQYQKEIAAAGDEKNLSFGDQVDAAHYSWYDFLATPVVVYKFANNDAGVKQLLIHRVQQKQEEYDQKARNLVAELAK